MRHRAAEEFCKTTRTGRGNVRNATHISTFRLGDGFLAVLGEVEDGCADFVGGVEALQHAHTDLLWERVGRRDVARHCRFAIRAHHFIGLVGFHCCQREEKKTA